MERAAAAPPLDGGLQLTEEQAATLAVLKQIRDKAGEHEERFAKVALVKAQRQSERDSALTERDALQTEVEKLQKHNEALQQRKKKLAARAQAAQQQAAAVVRDTAALAHSIAALQNTLRLGKAELQQLLDHRNAELEREGRYLEMQHQLVQRFSGTGGGVELEQELAFLDTQVQEANAELKEAKGAYAAYVSTKFGARGPSIELGIASNALFEDNTTSLADLQDRLTLLQKA